MEVHWVPLNQPEDTESSVATASNKPSKTFAKSLFGVTWGGITGSVPAYLNHRGSNNNILAFSFIYPLHKPVNKNVVLRDGSTLDVLTK